MHRYKQKHAADKSTSIKWGMTRTVSEKKYWVVTKKGMGSLRVCEHSSAKVLSVKMRCRVFPPSSPSLSLSLPPAASGLCLCDANCFCYLCQVPTLPQHILQTGPGPSAAFCVCLRNEKMCAAICNEHTTVPPPGRDCQSATMIGYTFTHTLSEVEKKKEEELCGRETRKQNWHIQLLIWNKIIQEVPVLMHLACGREDTVHLKKPFKFCKPMRRWNVGM